MTILDTNIFIYLANGILGRQLVAEPNIAHSSVTKVEALGFSSIPTNELLPLGALFSEFYNLAPTDSVVDRPSFMDNSLPNIGTLRKQDAFA